MLVLTRRIGEEIVIEGGIRVAVLTMDRQRVRLGITAPASVTVLREELVAEGAESPALSASARNRKRSRVTTRSSHAPSA
jgi:carbon storage regulator